MIERKDTLLRIPQNPSFDRSPYTFRQSDGLLDRTSIWCTFYFLHDNKGATTVAKS